MPRTQAESHAHDSTSVEKNLEQAASMILDVFRQYDVDNGGTLQRRELRNLLGQCGARLTSRQCDDIIDQLDMDGDGEMNFAEFMSFLGRLYQLQFFGTDPGVFWLKPGAGNPPTQPRNDPRSAPSRPPPEPPATSGRSHNRPLPRTPGEQRHPHSSPAGGNHQPPIRPAPPKSGYHR